MIPVLRVLAPNAPPVEYELGMDTIRVGRADTNHIVIANPQVSAAHLTLRRQREGGDGFRLIDEGSTNGTKVNGVRVREVVLQDGDEILMGGAVAAIFSIPSLSVLPKPESESTSQPTVKFARSRPPLKIAKPGPPPAAGGC